MSIDCISILHQTIPISCTTSEEGNGTFGERSATKLMQRYLHRHNHHPLPLSAMVISYYSRKVWSRGHGAHQRHSENENNKGNKKYTGRKSVKRSERTLEKCNDSEGQSCSLSGGHAFRCRKWNDKLKIKRMQNVQQQQKREKMANPKKKPHKKATNPEKCLMMHSPVAGRYVDREKICTNQPQIDFMLHGPIFQRR